MKNEKQRDRNSLEAKVYNQNGEVVGKMKLPERLFDLPWNGDLVHQVVTAMRANQRRGTAHTKDRSEVRGGGKKPWRQKGTGRARHGSIRSPLWRGGGTTFGPRRDKIYAQKINKKMKIRALLTVASRKVKDGELMLVDDLRLEAPKTKNAQEVLKRLSAAPGFEKLSYRRGKRAMIVLPKTEPAVIKSFRNLPTAALIEAQNVNPLDLLTYRYLVIVKPEESFSALSGRVK